MQHTPLVMAFEKVAINRFGHIRAAEKSSGARSSSHYQEAQVWLNASTILQSVASEDEQQIMQGIWRREMLKGSEESE